MQIAQKKIINYMEMQEKKPEKNNNMEKTAPWEESRPPTQYIKK